MADGMRALLQQRAPGIRVDTCVLDTFTAVPGVAPDVLVVVAPVLTVDDPVQLGELAQQSKVILLSKPENAHRAFEALKVGVRAVLSTRSAGDELVHVIRTVVEVDAVVAPVAARRFLQVTAGDRSRMLAQNKESRLTPREEQVLLLLAEGFSNGEIAKKLSISNATVRTHVHNVLGKLGARSRSQAVAIAYESRFIGDMRGNSLHS
ncbi:response regulator transcription factor [Streptomyces sp. NBC_01283]|uniref:DNA-binding response regulator n=1 Tax=Streptomyces sp. NBC_01283 TaxID=2903812 RepID=UPI00352F7798|nr:response regulator transcription factor [Streptomyces sp. NBC_01283]